MIFGLLEIKDISLLAFVFAEISDSIYFNILKAHSISDFRYIIKGVIFPITYTLYIIRHSVILLWLNDSKKV